MAENRVHHSQASMVSEQFENLKEATDSLTLEKHELEEELKYVSKELQSVRSSCGSGHESMHQQLARLQAELTVAETEYEQAQEREQEYKQKVRGGGTWHQGNAVWVPLRHDVRHCKGSPRAVMC